MLGPTSRTASISPDVNDPGYRNVTFDELVANYIEAIRGLVEGGADILLVETIFDTLNAKAALFAIEQFFERAGRRWPVMISGTITDASGRTLVRPDGRSLLEFAASHPAALLRPELRARRQASCASTSRNCRASATATSRAHPNAGLPNAFGGYDETPEMLADEIESWAQERHRQYRRRLLRHLARAHQGHRRTALLRSTREQCRKSKRSCACPGWSRSTSAPIRCSSTSASAPTSPARKAFARMILEGRFDDALAVARQQVENGAQVIDINMDEAMLDSQGRDGCASSS